MTKQEYLNALNEKLAAFDGTFRKEIIDAFEGHFQEGLENGHSEQEVIDSLGSVDDVVENIRMMHLADEERGHRTQELRSSLDSLSASLSNTIRSVSSMVTDSVNVAVRNIEAYTSGDHSADTEGTIETGEGTVLVIKGAHKGALDVFLDAGDRLDYHFSPTRSLFSTALAKLKITESDKHVTFSADDSAHLHLSIPDTIEEIRISLLSGDVDAKNLSLSCVRGKTMSGDWEFDNCEIGSLIIDTKSGDIEVDETKCDAIELSTYNGDLGLRRITGIIDAKTASGDIDVREHRGMKIRLEAISGDIDVNTICPDIDLLTVSGDIDLRSNGHIENINACATSGEVHAMIGDTDYTAVLQTASGDISNETDLRAHKRTSREWIVGDGLASVFLKSSSGDVTIE